MSLWDNQRVQGTHGKFVSNGKGEVIFPDQRKGFCNTERAKIAYQYGLLTYSRKSDRTIQKS